MQLKIKNFRSIRDEEIELAPMTVIYGPNGAGKSSVLYALLTMRNLVLNPNQNSSGFLNYGFLSLGDFGAVVFDHRVRERVELGLALDGGQDGTRSRYAVAFGENDGSFSIELPDMAVNLKLNVTFPYPVNQQAEHVFKKRQVAVAWNGITATARATPRAEAQEPPVQGGGDDLAAAFNAAAEELRRLAVVPLKRGFTRPHYSPVPPTPLFATEDEVANVLGNNKYLISKVSHYLERICGRDFRCNMKPGTAIFSLDATDRETGVASELVNEGFGVNQVVYMLASCLHDESQWVCLEEPEIHLHPTAVRALAKALVEIVHDEGRRFVITTHSEPFLLALLALVSEGTLKPDEVACYLARKEKRCTVFERQEVHENGQVEGGLASFMEGELADLKSFLKIES